MFGCVLLHLKENGLFTVLFSTFVIENAFELNYGKIGFAELA